MASQFVGQFLEETASIAKQLDQGAIDKLIELLLDVRTREGRLFILGVGGGAGHASHAVNDFRKIAGMEAYAPTDNVSELTARANDEGWSTVFKEWLKVSRLRPQDMLLIFSVGGGDAERNISSNLVEALKYAKIVGAKIGGIVGPKGGFTAETADIAVKVPLANNGRITPHTESFQAVVWHLLVSDPRLKISQTKWESAAK